MNNPRDPEAVDWPAEWTEEPPASIGALPEAFWASRSVLDHIRRAGQSAGVSSDLVLGAVLARLSAYVGHDLRFDSGAGGPEGASLNMFVAGLGAPGAGKSEGSAVAQRLIRPPRLFQTSPDLIQDGVPIGTGEGLIESFMGTVNEDDPSGAVDRQGMPKQVAVRKQVRHNAFVFVDEGQTLATLAARKGATIGATLRSAWNGEVLGQQNASEANTRIIRRRTYALGLFIGFQPETAIPLVDDLATGFPQRFLWVSAQVPFPRNRVAWPGELDVDLEGKAFGPVEQRNGTLLSGTMAFPQEVSSELWARKCDIAEGILEVGQLDTHEPLLRCKVAALLAVLDGRREVSVEDWDLSKVMWETSCAVRDRVVRRAAEMSREEMLRLRRQSADTAVAVADAVGEAEAKHTERVARLIERWVTKHREEFVAQGGERAEYRPPSRSSLHRQTRSTDRSRFAAALSFALEMSWIQQWHEAGRYEPGAVDPTRT